MADVSEASVGSIESLLLILVHRNRFMLRKNLSNECVQADRFIDDTSYVRRQMCSLSSCADISLQATASWVMDLKIANSFGMFQT